jgi:hypothetical protein
LLEGSTPGASICIDTFITRYFQGHIPGIDNAALVLCAC